MAVETASANSLVTQASVPISGLGLHGSFGEPGLVAGSSEELAHKVSEATTANADVGASETANREAT